MTARPFEYVGLDHVVLRVPDMGKALAFYEQVLGAKTERRIDQIGLVQLRVGRSLLDLVDINTTWMQGQGARPFDVAARNVDHICFAIDPFHESEIEAFLTAQDIAITERGDRYGAEGTGPSVYFSDPFGTTIELKGPAHPPERKEPVLRTERLILRPTLMSDADAMMAAFADPVAMRFWAHAPLTSLEQVRANIARNIGQRSETTSWALTHDGGKAFGMVNFYNISNRIAGMGYLLNKEAWGHGYVVEAARTVLDHGFNEMKLHRVYLDIDPDNAASIRVAEKLGFRREGHFVQSFFRDGVYFDSVFYAVLASEWPSRRRGVPSAP